MKVLSAETNLSSATNVSSASVVRIFNSDSSAATVTKKDSGGSTIGSFTMSAGEVVYSEKDYTDTLEGGSGLKVSKIGYSHMMSYSSYTSSSPPPSLVTANNVLLLDANSYSGSGKWLDESGSNNNGTLVSTQSGNPANGLTYVSDGDASYFDFANDGFTVRNRINMDSGMFDPNIPHTFSLWVRMNFQTNNQSFISEDNTPGGILYRYCDNSGGRHGLNLVRSYQTNHGVFPNTDSLTNNTIYNFTFTRTGSGSSTIFTAYINGLQQNPNSGATLGTLNINDTSFQTPNNIGSDQGGDDDIEGRLYHVMAYSNALTASEVLQNFNALKSRYGY